MKMPPNNTKILDFVCSVSSQIKLAKFILFTRKFGNNVPEFRTFGYVC